MSYLAQKASAGPFPLTGTAVEVLGPRIYLFGGYNGKTYSGDLHILETSLYSLTFAIINRPQLEWEDGRSSSHQVLHQSLVSVQLLLQ